MFQSRSSSRRGESAPGASQEGAHAARGRASDGAARGWGARVRRRRRGQGGGQGAGEQHEQEGGHCRCGSSSTSGPSTPACLAVVARRSSAPCESMSTSIRESFMYVPDRAIRVLAPVRHACLSTRSGFAAASRPRAHAGGRFGRFGPHAVAEVSRCSDRRPCCASVEPSRKNEWSDRSK